MATSTNDTNSMGKISTLMRLFSKSPEDDGTNRFRLLHYFFFFSLIAFIIILGASTLFAQRASQFVIDGIVSFRQHDTVTLTRSFAAAVLPELETLLTELDENGRTIPDMNSSGFNRLHDTLFNLTRESSIVKVKIYNLDSLTIYSSEFAQIGADGGDNPRLLSAIQGDVASDVTHRDTFNAFEGVIEDIDVVSSYVPVYDASGALIAVFEVYDNITDITSFVKQTQISVAVLLLSMLIVLYFSLFWLVRRAARIMNEQYTKIHTANTVLKEQQQHIQSSTQRYRDLIENISDIVFRVDIKGNFTYVSPSTALLTGYSEEQLIGLHFTELIEPSSRQTVLDFYVSHLKQRNLEAEITFPIVKPDGEVRWVEQKTTLMISEDSNIQGFQGVVRDITERKETERKLNALYTVMAQPTLTIDEQLAQAIRIGTQILGLDLGIISQIEDNTYTVLYGYSPDNSLQSGQRFEFDKTYCELAYQADGLVSIEHMGESTYKGHPCYTAFGLESYVGIPLQVNGSRFGTLNFSSATPRKRGITKADQDFFLLMAQWVSAMIERKLAQEQLKDSEANLRSIIDNSPAVITRSDRECRIEFTRVPGIDIELLDPLVGQNFLDFMPEHFHDKVRSAIHQVFENQTNAQYESTAIDPRYGEERWYVTNIAPIIEDGHVVSALLVNNDITERKMAEEKIQALLAAIPDMLFQINTDGVFLDFKSAKGLKTIMPPEAFLGKNIHEVLPPLAEPALHAVHAALQTGAEQMFNYELPEEDGLHTFEARITRSGNESALIIVRDITERKRAEELIQSQNQSLVKANREIALARKQAEASSKLKSQFLATMSHELRTPLNAVIGYAQLQLAGMVGEMTEEQLGFQERILANARHLLQLINEVLDLSKIEAGRLELAEKPFNLHELLEEIMLQNQVLAEDKGLKFEQVIDDRLPEILVGDRGRIKQVIINLISNAIKFTDYGSVKIDTTLYNKESWRITVTDTGAGISSTMQETIFDEFRQAENGIERGGTGLGLAIVRKLVLMMGGNIRLTSEVGNGSAFTITLPLITEKRYTPEALEA